RSLAFSRPQQRACEAGWTAGTGNTNLGAVEFHYLTTGRFEAGTCNRVPANHDQTSRCNGEHVATKASILFFRYVDQLDSPRLEQLKQRHRDDPPVDHS